MHALGLYLCDGERLYAGSHFLLLSLISHVQENSVTCTTAVLSLLHVAFVPVTSSGAVSTHIAVPAELQCAGGALASALLRPLRADRYVLVADYAGAMLAGVPEQAFNFTIGLSDAIVRYSIVRKDAVSADGEQC